MAGTSPNFNANDFRKNIRFVMNMGAPYNNIDQVSFHFKTVKTYNKPVDESGVPWDPAATFTSHTPDPIKVNCGVKFQESPVIMTAFGDAVPRKVSLTLLDQDYALVKDAEYILLGQVKYIIEDIDAPAALFNVGVYVMNCSAEGTT